MIAINKPLSSSPALSTRLSLVIDDGPGWGIWKSVRKQRLVPPSLGRNNQAGQGSERDDDGHRLNDSILLGGRHRR